MSRPQSTQCRGSAGFSLIELMVALVVGLIVTGSALTLVLTNRQTFAATEDMGRVQEGVRLAFELLGRELRGAGGNPCDSSLEVYSGLKDPEANWWSDWTDLDSAGKGITTAPSLRGYDNNMPFPDSAFGSAIEQRIKGTDAIEVKSAVPVSADAPVLMETLPATPSDALDVNSVLDIKTGDLLLLCNFRNASIFFVTGTASGDIEHTGAGADPWTNASGAIPQFKTGADDNFEKGALVSRVHAARWYIGNNGLDTDNDGDADGRSLYRATLVNNGGRPGVAVDEIAQDVADMQVSYLVRGATSYVDASAVGDFGNGANPVVGVRVELTFRGDLIGAGGERIARTMTQTVAIRGRAE